jgi:pimeloyl-ACP methyl ester carboxylesterase
MAELLDRIGPAVIMMHSAGGPTGWKAPDVRPGLVEGILAIEAAGSPSGQLLGYDQPNSSVADLSTVDMPATDSDLLPCTLQTQPARRLVHYRGLPVLSLTGEASSAWRTIQCGPLWINQAGGSAKVLRLEDIGIHGNGHLMMLEKNNAKIADAFIDWLERAAEKRHAR